MPRSEKPKPPPELEDQFESLLDAVWRNEREQDYQARIDRAVRLEEIKAKRRKPK